MQFHHETQSQELTPALPRGRPANRAIAEQIREARRISLAAARLAEAELEPYLDPKDQARPGYRRLYDVNELQEKLAWAKSLSGDSGQTLKKSFEQLCRLGAYRRIATASDPVILEPLASDFPNFAEVTDMIRRRLHLCRMAPDKLLKLPPILLGGPPGIGKTAYCKRLSGLLGMRFEQIDLSSGGVDFTMTGLDSGYSSGRPGRIWDSLKHECISVFWLLDELDKPGNSTKDSGVNYLLGLLEPVSARRFIDNATLLPLDASWLCYVATCNDLAKIEQPILSRFEVFEIAAPNQSQMRAVVDSIYTDIRQSEDWATGYEPKLGEDIQKALSTSTPREIRRRLVDGYANAAAHQRRTLLLVDIPPARSGQSEEQRRIGFV